MVRWIVACCAFAVFCGCGSDKNTTQPRCRQLAAPQSCANTVQEPVLPSDLVQDLGTMTVGTDATFVVSPGTGSFVIFSQEVGETAPPSVVVTQNGCPIPVPNAVVPRTVVSPGGTVLYDDFAPFPATTIAGGSGLYPEVSGLLAFDAGFQPVVGAFPFPNTSGGLADIDTRPGGEVEPGRWSFRFNDWAFECPFSGCSGGNRSGQYRVHVITRPVPGASSTLDLEVYLATDPTSVLSTAEGAANNADIERWKQSLDRFLGNAGISLREVNFHDLPADVKARYAPNGAVDVSGSGPCSNLNQLFTAAIEPKRAIHLFLADELVAPSGSNGQTRVAGVDGSIPGPSGFPGTIYGGAIVGLRDELGFESTPGACTGTGPPSIASCGSDRLAYITAHEIGHWLGLYHTTEMDGTFFDPLSNTARCACFACAPAPAPGVSMSRTGCAEVNQNPTTVVFNEFCTTANPDCGGGKNLMFWLLDDQVSTGELSDDQGRIMRLNPAVQ